MTWIPPRRLFVFLLVGLLSGGCVERILVIRTEPPGAEVYVDGRGVGPSPVEVPFVHYGGREVEARLGGYRSERLTVDVDPPWWQVPPFDFASELLDPRTHVDRRDFFVELAPISAVTSDSEELLRRAQELRRLAAEGDTP